MRVTLVVRITLAIQLHTEVMFYLISLSLIQAYCGKLNIYKSYLIQIIFCIVQDYISTKWATICFDHTHTAKAGIPVGCPLISSGRPSDSRVISAMTCGLGNTCDRYEEDLVSSLDNQKIDSECTERL